MKKYKLHLLVLLGLIIINLAFFAFNLKDFFLSDDFDWLNLTKSGHNLTDYFTSNYYGVRGEGGSYRPMVNLIFWLNYKIGGLNPLPYHLTNLIFHIGVAFLVYLLVLVLFEELKEKKKIAILAAVFFSLLPNHSEAVIWISAVADPMASFFYLLAFYLYLLFRKKEELFFLIFSVISFILALLTKEIAITLPLLIIGWELYDALSKNKFKARNIILHPFGYWLMAIGYLIVRYLAIGLFLGYYAREKFNLDLGAISKMFISLVTDLVSYGKMRVLLTNYFQFNKLFFIFLLTLIVTLICLALKNYRFKAPFLFLVYFILILPVLLLNFNNFTDEGERYNYLPSVIFCILLSLLIWQIKEDKFLRNLIVVACLLYFSFFLINKNYNWHWAARISQKLILNDFSVVVNLDKTDQKLLFVGLPDNFEGAPILRNGIKQAINLYYPNYNWDGIWLNAYLHLNRKNWDQKILNWSKYPAGGYLAKTIDDKFWVTGLDRRETENYIFELWHYNYSNYISDTIRLILKGDYQKALADKNLSILIFDQGHLARLNH